jgi:hypothetical protein
MSSSLTVLPRKPLEPIVARPVEKIVARQIRYWYPSLLSKTALHKSAVFYFNVPWQALFTNRMDDLDVTGASPASQIRSALESYGKMRQSQEAPRRCPVVEVQTCRAIVTL